MPNHATPRGSTANDASNATAANSAPVATAANAANEATAAIAAPPTLPAECSGTIGPVLTPAGALKAHIQHLSLYEQAEILDYPQVYFVGHTCNKTRPQATFGNNHGFDDERGDYIIMPRDHMSYRYEVISLLGKGSFGEVYQVVHRGSGEVPKNSKAGMHQILANSIFNIITCNICNT